MIQNIINYKNILSSLEELIANSHLKKQYIIEASGISAPTFYRKLKNLSFTPDETLKIINIVNPKEAYMHELKESINRGKEDFKNKRIHSREDILKDVSALLE